MTNVPPGWTPTTIGALGRYLNGRAFKKDEWAITGRPIIRIQNLTGSSTSFNYFQGDVEERYVARPGELLVSWAATLGAYIWNGPEAVVNQHIFKVESNIDLRFHKHLLDHKLDELKRQAHGSGMVHITRGRFDSVRVVVPPLEEQRRIVDILEDHLSRLDAAVEGVRATGRKVVAWSTGAIDATVWTREPHESRTIGSLLRERPRNGHSARASRSGQGTRALTLTAVTRRAFSDEFTKIVSVDEERVRDLWLEPGDIFVQRANTAELVGSVAMYSGPSDWAIFPDLLIRLRIDEHQASAAYVEAAMRSERAHRALRAQAKGLAGSMPKIDQAAIAGLRIPVPRRERQAEVSAQVAEIDATSVRLIEGIRETVQRTTILRRALLDAAFLGRLTGRSSDLDRVEELAGV